MYQNTCRWVDFVIFATASVLCVLFKCFYAFDSKNSVDLIYTDVAKAFDNVCHSKLISVLLRYGVKDNLSILNWIKCFLTDRSQHVCINNSCSASLPVKSGVLQGRFLESRSLVVIYRTSMMLLVWFLRIIQTVKCFYVLMMLNFSAVMLLACNRVWINSQTGSNFINLILQ